MDLDKLIKGIELLNKDTLPNWGKMNSSMMLKHCSAFIDVYLNKTKLNPLIFLVGFILLVTVIIITILIFYDLPKNFDYFLEWNYFLILLFFYLLTFFMWKKKIK